MEPHQWRRWSPRFLKCLFFLAPLLLIANLSIFLLALREREKAHAFLMVSIFFLTGVGFALLAGISLLWNQNQEQQARASRSLLEKEEKLQAILHNVPLIMWAVDPVGLCTMYEGLGVEQLGPDAPSLAGRNVFEALREHPDVLRAVRQSLLGETTKIESRFGKRCYESTMIPLFDRKGIKGMVGISMDITDRKSREMEAELASQAKSRFLANMSHEIRTPLGIILGFIDLLGATDLTEAEREKYMKKIRLNAEALAALVNDILDLSKVEAGRLDVEWSDVCVKGVLNDLRESFETRAQDKGLAFSVEIPENLPAAIRTDLMLLRQILVNLLGNALKFTEKGSVRLVIHQHPVSPGKTQLCFQVIDTGIGMSDQHRQALFASFSQGDPSMARRYGGTGLGLALSKKLAELLGGDLQLVSSRPGEGSVFQLNLVAEIRETADSAPLRKSQEKQAGLERSSRLQGLRVLLVEDAVDNQALVSTLLRRNGAVVDFASDGREGVEKARAGDWDLVLMDIQMPGMDGFEATRLLREAGFAKPILALTAHALREERDRAIGAGFDGYLTKPIDRLELVSKIEGCVKIRTLGRGACAEFFSGQGAPENRGFPTV